jgi:predicted nucleic acid-binding protein
MIVLDASVVVEFLVRGGLAAQLAQELGAQEEKLIAPHVLDLEVLSAFRSLAAGRRIDSHRGEQFLTDFETLPVGRYAHTLFLPRIWELRHNFTTYDAAYIALAEGFDATLYTTDAKLAKSHRARVKLFRL